MTDTTEIDLELLKELMAAATPGPWHLHIVDETMIVNADGCEVATTCNSENAERVVAYDIQHERMAGDASLIAAARNALPALIAEHEALRTQVSVMREALEAVDKDIETTRNQFLGQPLQVRNSTHLKVISALAPFSNPEAN